MTNLGEKQIAVVGLGLFMLLAGASKFFLLDFWIGFEPQILVNLLPLTADQLTLLGGGIEVFLGLILLTRKKAFYFSVLTSLWLLMITLQVTRLGLWDLAIRDLGLVFYSLTTSYLLLEEK